MRDIRNSACAVAIIAALSAVAIPAFAGYAGVEGGPAPASAHAGFVAGFVAHLKREDDEAEVKQLAESQPSLAEREAVRESREADPEEQARPPEPQQESE
jgi:hypothetical protein